MFSEVNDTTSYARIVANGLEEDGVWVNKFLEYCRNKSELMGYFFRKEEETARKYIARKNFGKAADIYRNIIKQCGPHQEKTIYEFKLYECLFNGGQCDSVIHDLDSFLKNNKTTHKVLISKAMILKGQAYVQLGNIDLAIDTFFALMIEYPETRQASEANFFVGYCYMLQSKFDEATEAFNIVVKDYPGSSYASKARSSLMRIKNIQEYD
jgi:outer membrane protein assembly factor BamD (BamD/ComL family)